MVNYKLISSHFITQKNWEGVKMQNGFGKNFGHRMYRSRKLFYQTCREKQYLVAQLLGSKEILAKAQLAPFFLFPGNELAAEAALGWTQFLEYQEQCKKLGNQLSKEIEIFLENCVPGMWFGPKIKEKLCKAIAETLNIKLSLEALSRNPSFKEVETYRVMTCNLMDPTLYSSIEQTLRWSILYDDLLPDSLKDKLNPGVKELFELLRKVNGPFLFMLKKTGETEFLGLAKQWGEQVLKVISASYQTKDLEMVELKPKSKMDKTPAVPITVEESRDPKASLLPYIEKDEIEDALGEENMDFMQNLANDLYEAAEKPKSWEDPKPDQVSSKIIDPFNAVPEFEGELQECDFFEFQTEDGQILSAEVIEESLPISEDQKAIVKIQFHSESIKEELDKILYKNLEKTISYKVSDNGSDFHNNLLPLYKCNDQIFKKVSYHQRTSTGKPILVLIVDISGSMVGAPMECTKVITAAWSMHKDLKLLAAAYTTASTPVGEKAVVRWISHPKNTKGDSRNESLGRIASVSDMKPGGNKDAAAIFKILSEVRKMASPMDKVYLVHLTDTGFFKSFHNTSDAASSEINTVIKHFKNKVFKKRLHTTLVALTNSVTEYDSVDELCQIPSNLHQDYLGIAEKINESLGKTISKTFK